MNINYQKEHGASLIIAFLVMSTMLMMALGVANVLLSQVNIVASASSSLAAFYLADSGVEKTLYLNSISEQVGQPGIGAGFCGICAACQSTTNDCSSCTLTPLAANGCSNPPGGTCNNCKISYSSSVNGGTFDVQATLTPSASGPVFYMYSTGYYNNLKGTSYFDSSN